MIGFGVFDRLLKLLALIVLMGGELAAMLGRIDASGTSTTMVPAACQPTALTRTSDRHPPCIHLRRS